MILSVKCTRECPPLQVNGSISQQELLSLLTHPCRYDATALPSTVKEGPLFVKAKMFVYHLQKAKSTNVVSSYSLKFITIQAVYELFEDILGYCAPSQMKCIKVSVRMVL